MADSHWLASNCRFRDFHVVAQPPHIRSYVGTPIVLANGYRVGVLCALDTKPHALSAASTRLMVNVAGLVAREIEGLAGDDYDLPLQPKVLLTEDLVQRPEAHLLHVPQLAVPVESIPFRSYTIKTIRSAERGM